MILEVDPPPWAPRRHLVRCHAWASHHVSLDSHGGAPCASPGGHRVRWERRFVWACAQKAGSSPAVQQVSNPTLRETLLIYCRLAQAWGLGGFPQIKHPNGAFRTIFIDRTCRVSNFPSPSSLGGLVSNLHTIIILLTQDFYYYVCSGEGSSPGQGSA